MSDFMNQVQQLADDAPEAGFVNVNYGKLTVKPMVVIWREVDGIRSPDKRDLVSGYQLQEGETMELVFTVNISELNPNLTFEYERNVPVRKSGNKKTDWDEIVRPSLEKVFGKQWAKAVIGATPYVAVEDFPNVAGKASSNGKVYGVPKLIAVYKSKAECQAARDERYKNRGEPAAADASVGVPEAIIAQVKGLVNSIGAKAAYGALTNKPFGDYEPAMLFEVAELELPA